MYKKRIKQLVSTIIEKHDLYVIPIDIERLAKDIGAEIRREDFDEELSGFALQKDGSKFIGVNSSELPERQRFTIAHEIGHLLLHDRDNVNYDPGVSVLLLRDTHASDGTDEKEIEANRFAAELLMPEAHIRDDIRKRGQIDLMADDDDTKSFIADMANKYKVSYSAMSIRLTTLYFN